MLGKCGIWVSIQDSDSQRLPSSGLLDVKLTDSETLTASKAVGVDFDECLWESTLTSLWESTFTNIVYHGTSTGP